MLAEADSAWRACPPLPKPQGEKYDKRYRGARAAATRRLGELAVRIGTSNLLPEGVPLPSTMGPPSHFGAGGRVGIGPEAGIFGWAGAAGTIGTVDMRRGLRSSLFVQFMPPQAMPLLTEYQKALRADVLALG